MFVVADLVNKLCKEIERSYAGFMLLRAFHLVLVSIKFTVRCPFSCFVSIGLHGTESSTRNLPLVY